MKKTDKIEIKKIQTVKKQDFIILYSEAGWWKPEYNRSTDFIDKLVCNSTIFVGAYENQKLIGMGRALSDGVSDAFIQDVVVLNQYRRQGIGQKIVKMIVHHLKKEGVDWIGLIGKPGTESFYRDLGFHVLTDHIPMVLKD